MESKIFKYFKSKLIFNKYSLKYLIAKGSFGEVFLGTNIIDKKNYALKIEDKNNNNPLLTDECHNLINLKGPGIPSVISFGVSGNYRILVENLLGKSILDIWKEKNKKLNLQDTCIFAIQALSLLEYVHSKDYIHRDIKPANFLVGFPDNSQLYLIDFGNARKYRSSRTGKHIKLIKNNLIFGSLIFLSLNALKGIEQTRKDELESLGLVIIYLFKGSLPWSIFNYKDFNQGIKRIRQIREEISIENMCKGMPQEMNYYMNYVKNLKYEEKPDYDYLRSLFFNDLKKIGVNEPLFSWVDKNIRTKGKSPAIKTNISFRNIFNNLLNKNSIKENSVTSLKLKLNNNEKQINDYILKSDIIKIKEIKNKSFSENNYISNTQFNSKNKVRNRIKINDKKMINNNKIENIKEKNNQKLKKIAIYKRKPDLTLDNLNKQNIIQLQKPYKKIIQNQRNDNNSNNNDDKLSNNNKGRNKFKNNLRFLKTEENSFKDYKIKNIININNINITNNSSINDDSSFLEIFKNYKTSKLNNNKKNNINSLNQLTFNAKRNNYSNRKYFNILYSRPTSYKSVFSNESIEKAINLTEIEEQINQFKLNQIKKENGNQNKFNNPMIYYQKASYIEKKNNYQTRKYYQPKFLFAFRQSNSPTNNNIK